MEQREILDTLTAIQKIEFEKKLKAIIVGIVNENSVAKHKMIVCQII